MSATATSTPVLEIDGIHLYYGAIHALKGVSLTVGASEIVTLIGANGAGKSSTLRAIQGINRVREGRIRFQGDDITNGAPHAIVRGGIVPVQVHADELAQAEPRRVEQLEDRPIATPERRVGVDGVEERGHLGLGEVDRNGAVQPGRDRHRRRVVVEHVLAPQVAQERPHARELPRHRAPGPPGPVEGHQPPAHRRVVEIARLEPRDRDLPLRRQPGQELGDVAVVGAQGVRRHVAVELEVVEKGREMVAQGLWPFGRRSAGEETPAAAHGHCRDARASSSAARAPRGVRARWRMPRSRRRAPFGSPPP